MGRAYPIKSNFVFTTHSECIADISRLLSCESPAAFQCIAVTSFATDVKAEPMPIALVPIPIDKNDAPVVSANTTAEPQINKVKLITRNFLITCFCSYLANYCQFLYYFYRAISLFLCDYAVYIHPAGDV